MKRKVGLVLLIVILMLGSTSIGANYSQEIKALLTNTNVLLDSNPMVLSKQPISYDGTLYIPVNDMAKYINYEAVWIEQSNTVYLFKKAGQGSFLDMNNPNTNNTTNDFIKTLNNNYELYDDGAYDLEFKYEIKNYENYAKVKGLGQNFDKDTSKWKKRDKNDFQDFIENLLKIVAKEYEKDTKIYIYDDDNDVAGEYEYDYSSSKFKVLSEKGNYSTEKEAEDSLEDYYEVYEGDEKDLEFKYDVDEYSSYIKVKMEGKNFDKNDDGWEDRGISDFKDFVEEFAEQISESFEKDVKIYVYDEDDDLVVKYKYVEDDEELENY
ncbi:hypothetical protein [Abyssisolibacter fermentans]|uniref:hypothetical protein n=1 Tax=Abyssisolibacter fermentans TaxID=1766203 RepID=UPI000836D5A7|nr:hypothetical protein [Abyssisolibacter fermentans]